MKVVHYHHPEEAGDLYDKCIAAAPNGTIYALSWYLNITCPSWELLCTEDFSSVMPLPVVKSMGRKILRQPEFTYQLGVFSTAVPDPETIRGFLLSIPRNYRLKTLCMNKFNQVESRGTRQYNSSELDLISSRKILLGQYNAATRAALEKAKTGLLYYQSSISAHEFLEFAYRFDVFNSSKLKPRSVQLMRLIASNAMRYTAGQISAAYDAHNSLCASILFLKFNGRVSIHHVAANNEGIRNGALHLILDEFIKENTETNLVLCIDDPDSRAFSDIFRDFGATLSTYPCLKNLP